MSKAYEDFTRETYRTIYGETAAALRGSGDLPVLVVSGEMHGTTPLDSKFRPFIPERFQNPAVAALFTHLSALQAATDLVGKDHVVLSVELNQEQLDQLKNNAALVASTHNVFPLSRAAALAYLNGYEVVASDPGRSLGPNSPARYDAEIEAIGKIALRTEEPPKIVVHIGGAAHIGTLQGYALNDLKANGDDMVRDAQLDPFDGIYGGSAFFNSAQATPQILLDSFGNSNLDYFRDPRNATQIDPPGRPDESDLANVTGYLQSVSRELHGSRSVAIKSAEEIHTEQVVAELSQKDLQELEKQLGAPQRSTVPPTPR